MTAKSTRTPTATANSNEALAPLNWLADLPRRQLEFMARSASSLLRGSEAIRTIQQQTAHRARSHHESAVERLRSSQDLGEVMAIQAELMQYNMREAAQYWQQLATTAFRAQVDLVGGTTEVLQTGTEPTLEAFQQAFAASLDSATGVSTH